ncbi:response regulator transcription factor [uncultured Sphingomonas sp.]|uniref:response regulator transcription factor n=1 Tax=uncultured Sphingomonas sp. TaxID=158754 RepID=UPI0025D25B24|nr:response regulator transcription factor [uncultured Sphingomonas sp.]
MGLSILYVEDDRLAAAAMLARAAEGGDHVIWEESGATGLSRAAAEPFDIIILDRMLPDLDGTDVVRRLRAAGVDTPVLMLSALALAGNRIEGLDAGADDYLSKPYEPDELIARVRALHRRAVPRPHSAVLLHGSFECHLKSRTAFRGGVHLPLSPKEFELFRYLMENAGGAVTRQMLLRDVWNMGFDPQTNVVDVQIGRLRRKLDYGFATPGLETIWGAGYRLTEGR